MWGFLGTEYILYSQHQTLVKTILKEGQNTSDRVFPGILVPVFAPGNKSLPFQMVNLDFLALSKEVEIDSEIPLSFKTTMLSKPVTEAGWNRGP